MAYKILLKRSGKGKHYAYYGDGVFVNDGFGGKFFDTLEEAEKVLVELIQEVEKTGSVKGVKEISHATLHKYLFEIIEYKKIKIVYPLLFKNKEDALKFHEEQKTNG